MKPLDALRGEVREYFRAHAAQYGFNPAKLKISYVFNSGGFVNPSFHISDGQKALHLKLTNDEDSLVCLEQWRDLHAALEKHYRAPRMLGWVDLENTGFSGPLFEHIPGKVADFRAQPELYRQVMELAARLHADRALTAELAEDESITCTDYFLSVYIDRFDEDLLEIAGDLPPFVSLKTLDWMQGETRELEALARELPVFAEPADHPTHGDLYSHNVLVTRGGEWYVIDWDDLALGDPALEWSILLSPLWRQELEQGRRLTAAELTENLPVRLTANELERLDLYLRAYLLDEIIDSLADYNESAFAPEYQEEVQREEKRIHQEALAWYQRFYRE